MGGPKALENAYDLTRFIEDNNITGDIVECGVAQGGTASMMALVNKKLGKYERGKWFFDSYQGLPNPTKEDYINGKTGDFIRPLPKGSCLGTLEEVSNLMFNILNLNKKKTFLIKGWFQNTIKENKENPFFLYFAMNVPHTNNEAGNQGMEVPEIGEFTKKSWPEPEKGFAAMIKNIDRDVGQIIDLIDELNLANNTLVIFTSDNGPHQEGGHRADFFNSSGPFRGIKRDLTEGGIRVPTIAWWPGKIKANTTNDHQWYFGDFMKTFAELAETPAPEDIDSDSFVSTLTGNPPEKKWARNSRLYWEFHERGSAQAVRFGKWKAIRKPMFTGPIELYDLSIDLKEENNYSERRPDLVKHAQNLLDQSHEPDFNWSARKNTN